MILDPIMPEVYTFLDFTNHQCRMNKKHGINKYYTHIGGEIPDEHPMPYNVYLKVSTFLKKNPDATEKLVSFLKSELEKPGYGYKSVTFSVDKFSYKKGFLSQKMDLPFINVNIEF